MVAQSCLLRRPSISHSSLQLYSPCKQPWRHRFHQSSRLRDEQGGMPDHYATLNLQPNASIGEIKKSFYKLSKAHHPDLHPSDPSASKRFVAISEAYSTLGSPTKKQSYDRDFLRASPTYSPSPSYPSGSHSSASTGPGGRPASGLSRRRTQFRGPPPSFYRSGGWGAHSEKRSEHASGASRAHERASASQAGAGPGPGPAGTGPGGFTAGFDNDVPHFDQRGHYQRHSELEKTRHRARRKVGRTLDDMDYSGGSSPMFGFILVSSVLGIIFGASAILMHGDPLTKKERKEEA